MLRFRTEAARGFGIYATHIAPVGEETIEEVIVNCFRGDATPARPYQVTLNLPVTNVGCTVQ